MKQILGLVGYYRKFVPRFSDISRVLTHLIKKDVEFKWTPKCENCFQILKSFYNKHQYSNTQLYTVHRWFKICIRRHPNPKQQWHGPPNNLCKRTIPWISIKLGHTHQRSLCNLHVSEKTQLLHRHSQNNSKK